MKYFAVNEVLFFFFIEKLSFINQRFNRQLNEVESYKKKHASLLCVFN